MSSIIKQNKLNFICFLNHNNQITIGQPTTFNSVKKQQIKTKEISPYIGKEE
jgi:hypothetical protein